MKKTFSLLLIAGASLFFSCNTTAEAGEYSNDEQSETLKGQSGVQDDESDRNVVQVAMGSADHTTLVKAVKAAELVDALSNAGPFTVFAPTNQAFDQLPAGILKNLLKPENKADLIDILQYHVIVGVYPTDRFTDGQEIGQVNGDQIVIGKSGDEITVNGNSKIIASIPAANGVIHVVDAVLLPPAAAK